MRGAERLCTRVQPSSRAVAVGPRSSTVWQNSLCPSFGHSRPDAAIPGAVHRHEDRMFGMVRTEITCSACGGHLGHVFKGEGFPTPSEHLSFRLLSICSPVGFSADERHCVNSISLKFVDEKKN